MTQTIVSKATWAQVSSIYFAAFLTNQKENFLQYLTEKSHSQYEKIHATQKNA